MLGRAIGPWKLSHSEQHTSALEIICLLIHVAGEMVIEYVGDLIRPSVADVRERASYNSLVGCGTYVFRCVRRREVNFEAAVLTLSSAQYDDPMPA